MLIHPCRLAVFVTVVNVITRQTAIDTSLRFSFAAQINFHFNKSIHDDQLIDRSISNSSKWSEVTLINAMRDTYVSNLHLMEISSSINPFKINTYDHVISTLQFACSFCCSSHSILKWILEIVTITTKSKSCKTFGLFCIGINKIPWAYMLRERRAIWWFR